jgi:4'-phosphopantetheinyl transferase
MDQSIRTTRGLPPPAKFTLSRNEVHVWRASLDQNEATIEGLWRLLTPEERQRAQRYVRKESQQQFVVARGVLRQIIALYTGLAPAALKFTSNRYGRPLLSKDSNPAELDFNLSHSGNLVLYAFSRGRVVGIDIEAVRKEIATLNIAENFFSPDEVTTLKSVSEDMHTVAFFNCWTRKEAYIKAVGEGLSHPLHNFSVSLAPHEEAALLSVRGDQRAAARWKIYALEPGTGYVAAVIAENPPFSLREWEYVCN